MATSNFHNVNASKVFAVNDEYDYEFEYVKSSLEITFWSHEDYTSYIEKDRYELRSFPSRTVSTLSKWIEIGEDSVEVSITSVIRSGYYEGFNLDWFTTINVNGSEDDSFADNEEVKKIIDSFVEYIENIYAIYSEPLNVVGRFSNGETIYEKAK
jgi:hypothetical protein